MRELVNKLLAAVGAPTVDKAISFRTAYRIGAVCERLWPLLRLRGEPPLTRFLAEQLCTPHWYSMEPARRDFGYVPQIAITGCTPPDREDGPTPSNGPDICEERHAALRRHFLCHRHHRRRARLLRHCRCCQQHRLDPVCCVPGTGSDLDVPQARVEDRRVVPAAGRPCFLPGVPPGGGAAPRGRGPR
ncbi:hypothetical protein G6F57_018412 [Rhizopus arrhizus]|nr:hypothetical protein G6F57_018412 [Rhizopus arrhizus]